MLLNIFFRYKIYLFLIEDWLNGIFITILSFNLQRCHGLGAEAVYGSFRERMQIPKQKMENEGNELKCIKIGGL